jgi:hypothetical protein
MISPLFSPGFLARRGSPVGQALSPANPDHIVHAPKARRYGGNLLRDAG